MGPRGEEIQCLDPVACSRRAARSGTDTAVERRADPYLLDATGLGISASAERCAAAGHDELADLSAVAGYYGDYHALVEKP